MLAPCADDFFVIFTIYLQNSAAFESTTSSSPLERGISGCTNANCEEDFRKKLSLLQPKFHVVWLLRLSQLSFRRGPGTAMGK